MAKSAKRKYTLPQILLLAVLLIATALYRYYYGGEQIISLEDIPEYSGEAYVAINGNQPFFAEADDTTVSYETYSPLDGLGRCGVAEANAGKHQLCEAHGLAFLQIRLRGRQKPLQPLPPHRLPADGGERQQAESHYRHSIPECHRYAAL